MKFVWLLVAALFVAIILGFEWPGDPSTSAASTTATKPAKPSPVPLNDQLRRAGTWLVDRRGRVVILHGVNAVWKLAPYVPPNSVLGFSDADADWLSDHGFNAVRLGVLFAGVMPHQGLIDHGYLEKVDRVVKLLKDGPVRWTEYRAGIPGPVLKEMIAYERPPERRGAMVQAFKARWVARRPP